MTLARRRRRPSRRVASLADAGLRYLQLDDTNLGYLFDDTQRANARARGLDPDALPRLYARIINEAIRDRPDDMTVCVHVCRGNFRSSWAAEGGYEPCVDGPPLARGFEALHSAGRGGHVSGLSMRLCHAPLAMMPFARTGSRPIARARSATAQNGFSRSGGFNRLGASTPLCPFQHRRRESSAPKLYTATASGSRYRSPLVISAQTIRAFLFASATAATLVGRRASSWTNQGRLVPCRWA